MSYKPACSAFKDPETFEIARFGLANLRASAALFYWVDGPLGMEDVELEGLAPQFFHHYAAQMVNLDPLHVTKMALGRQNVARLVSAEGPSADLARYKNFLGQYGIVDVIDLLFWSEGHPVAGLGVLKRVSDAPICGETISDAIALQRFVEHVLGRHRRIAHARRRGVLAREFGLTSREVEVAELAAQGARNAEIAARLEVGLPTVKTHLLHALSKTGSANRTELGAILSRIG
jgi:DNA-binding CsgD family transcriptional regulator